MPAKKLLTDEEKEYIIQNYFSMSTSKIGKELLISDKIIEKFAKENNLTKKRRVEIGDVFNRLTVIGNIERVGDSNNYIVLCRCSCDNRTEKKINISHLKSGKIKSCGCLNTEIKKSRKNTKKGSKYSSKSIGLLYQRYKDEFCQEWLDISVFEKWLFDNDYQHRRFLMRRNKDEKHSPSNSFLSLKMDHTNTKRVKKTKTRNKRGIKIGDRFGRLEIIGEPFWCPSMTVVVQCDCGTIKTVLVNALLAKDSVSCGCYHIDISRERMLSGEFAKTVMKNHGVENYSNHPDFVKKTQATCLSKYGVDNYSKTKESKLNNSKKLTKIFFNGETIEDVAERTGYSYLEVSQLTNRHGDECILWIKKKISSIQAMMETYLRSINIEFQSEKIIGNYRADIFIPKYNLILELDGVYWHCDKNIKDKKYHIKKKEFYNEAGYDVLFFREDELIDKFEIVKSIINNKIGLSKKIFARKCIAKEVKEGGREFFLNNHLMGIGQGKIFGLYYNDELVCAMRCKNKGEYMEISRFCSVLGCSIVGGFTKLLSVAEKDFNKPVITFIDRRYGDGEYLTEFGFELKTRSISFRWVKKRKSVHRMKFPNNTGYENGWYKLWDCGQYKYVKE